MSFSEVIGHEKVKDYLKKIVKENHIAHAMMFEGVDGIGKSLLGMELAKAIFCDSKSGDACGSCRHCLKMAHDNHPDFLLIEPDGKQIKNAQIESFQEFLNVKAYDAKYKVVLIKDADKMNASSQNRILKTLEEPPNDVIIIMITNNSEKLLPTVVSRCQIIKLNGIREEKIVDFLMNGYDLNEDESKMIAKLSIGSIGKAHNYVDSEVFEKIRKEVKALLLAINNNERSNVLGVCSFLTSEKESILDVLEYMILWYRDILLYKKAKAKSLLVHEHELDLIKKLTRNLSIRKIIQNIETIEMTKKKLNQHGHFDLTTEVMLIKLLED